LWRHRSEYDVIHVFHGRLHALPAVFAGLVLAKPAVVKIGRGGFEHFDLDIVRSKRFFGRWYADTIIHCATAYVANSFTIADDLQRWHVPAAKVHRIPNGVELPVLDSDQPRSDVVRFLFLGRLDPEKALHFMIRGIAALPDSARVMLTIVGDGDCREELEQLVDELGARARVTFTGAVSDVEPALRENDVYVSTSLSEGMSNSLLEAMSFGLMPLVSLVSGVTDVVDDRRSGLLFVPGDLDAFVSKLAETVALSFEGRRELGLAARAAMEDKFNIDGVARLHVELYDQLLGASR
jgi:glycosyltransferase involved in cell wall biosynthesis